MKLIKYNNKFLGWFFKKKKKQTDEKIDRSMTKYNDLVLESYLGKRKKQYKQIDEKSKLKVPQKKYEYLVNDPVLENYFKKKEKQNRKKDEKPKVSVFNNLFHKNQKNTNQNKSKSKILIVRNSGIEELDISEDQLHIIKPLKKFSLTLISINVALFFILFLSFCYAAYIYKRNNILKNDILVKSNEIKLAYDTMKEERRDINMQKAQIMDATKSLYIVKSYLQSRGAYIKPQYKSSLNKNSRSINDVGGEYHPSLDVMNLKKTTVFDNSKAMPINLDEIKFLLDNIKKVPIGYPYRGIITSLFGVRVNPFTGEGSEGHTGIDIKGNYRDPVYATAKGVVVFVGYKGGYGNAVVIKHEFGYTTLFGHLAEANVRVGQKITANNIIGFMGSTGRSTGVHVHYEVRKNDVPVNPEYFLSFSNEYK